MGYFVIGFIALAGLVAVGIFVYRLIKEIGPTVHQAKSTAEAFQSTIQESKELGEHFKSISEAIQRERAELQVATEAARQTIGQISNIVSVAKPMGDTIQLLKRQIEPQPVPVKAKRFLEKVKDRSRKVWQKAGVPLQKKIYGDSHGTRRLLKYSGIPLLVGTAAGGYAVYWKRRRDREKREDLSADFGGEFNTPANWNNFRKLSPPDYEMDAKKKSLRTEIADETSERRTSMKEKLILFWSMIKQTYNDWDNDHAASMGASLAYYTVFSLSPLLIIAIAIAGFMFGKQAAQGEIVRQIGGLVGHTSAEAIQQLIDSARRPASGIIATVLGVVTLLFGASGVFSELHSSLERIWNIPQRAGLGVWHLIKERFLSFTMVLGIGFLLLVSLVLSAGLTALGTFVGNSLPASAFVLQIVNAVISFGVITLLFAMIYKILPAVRIEWSDVWLGSLITALFFEVGKFFIGLYLGSSSVGTSFGAAGSLVLILVWVYYSAQVFLFGAEFTQVFAKRRGSWSIGKKAAAA
jgi:membrane protein